MRKLLLQKVKMAAEHKTEQYSLSATRKKLDLSNRLTQKWFHKHETENY